MSTPPAPPARTPRKPSRTPRDMALSLLVLIIPVLLVVLTYRFLHNGDQPVVVDTGPAIAQARTADRFPVAEPTGLSADWRPVSAVYRAGDGGATLRLGYVTPSRAGLQLIQSDVPPETLLARELGAGAVAHGIESIGGTQWQRYTARKNENALVRSEAGRTLVVIGDAPLSEVRTLAASVR